MTLEQYKQLEAMLVRAVLWQLKQSAPLWEKILQDERDKKGCGLGEVLPR